LGLVARRKDLLDEIVAEIEAGNKPNGDRATDVLTIQGDVQSSESMRSAAESLRSRFGKIDMLIANAGIGVTNDAAELDAAKVANVINVNVIGAANSVAAVLPEM